ncbi:MAG: hypothetical protein HYY02_12505 [Chloroflexi bacterium]|nr:hypothetical protein [Chloroflexota bacterium]
MNQPGPVNPPEIVRLICLVHGVGSQPKGEFLEQVVAPLMRWVAAWPGVGPAEFRAQLRPEQGPARATVRIVFPRRTERWEFVEAHWASAFYPEAEPAVLTWGYRMLLELPEIVPKMLREVFGDDPPPRLDPAYRPLPKAFPSRLYDWLVGSVLGIVWHAFYLAALALGVAFFLLSLLPSWLLAPDLARRVLRGLMETLVAGIGDLLAMARNPASLASISNTLAEAIRPHLAPTDGTAPPASLVVLAHSGGATAAFYSLSGADFWRSVAGADGPPIPTTLITAGSSLNFAWLTRRWLVGAAQQPLWRRQLPAGLRWVDVYTRYDPVPHGQPRDDLVGAVRGGAELNVVRVVNHDSFFDDHGAYWENYLEFVPRFAYEIMGQDAAALRRIDWDGIRSRRRRVGAQTFLRLLAAALSLGALAAYQGEAYQATSGLLSAAAASSPGLLATLLTSLAASQPLVLLLDYGVLAVLLAALLKLAQSVSATLVDRPYEPEGPAS